VPSLYLQLRTPPWEEHAPLPVASLDGPVIAGRADSCSSLRRWWRCHHDDRCAVGLNATTIDLIKHLLLRRCVAAAADAIPEIFLSPDDVAFNVDKARAGSAS
jgi:hypothetical protein